MIAVAVLHRLAARADAGELGEDGPFLAAALRSYLAGAADGVSLDHAFGLAPMPGQAPWWSTAARERRDNAIRQFARELYPAGPIAARETALRAELRRYERRWRADRYRPAMPPNYAGKPERWLFKAYHAHAELHRGGGRTVYFPLGSKWLRSVLATPSLSVIERIAGAEMADFSTSELCKVAPTTSESKK